MFTVTFIRRLGQIISHSHIVGAKRLSSTLVGASGRTYTRYKVLYDHPKDPKFDLHLAFDLNAGPIQYVVKRVLTSQMFERAKALKDTFGENPLLRTHIDCNEEEHTLVYDYFKADVLALVSNEPALPLSARKKILHEIARGIDAMHSEGWVHLDVKPNNVLIDLTISDDDIFRLQKVTLGDLDCAMQLTENEYVNGLVGNVRWRSPEGQLARGTCRASEVFSFGLLCMFVLTRMLWLEPDWEDKETIPEHMNLFRLLRIFGPLPERLVSHVDHEESGALLRDMWQGIEEEGLFEPFMNWRQMGFADLEDDARRLISGMTNLDPAKRLTMAEVLKDAFWSDVVEFDK